MDVNNYAYRRSILFKAILFILVHLSYIEIGLTKDKEYCQKMANIFPDFHTYIKGKSTSNSFIKDEDIDISTYVDAEVFNKDGDDLQSYNFKAIIAGMRNIDQITHYSISHCDLDKNKTSQSIYYKITGDFPNERGQVTRARIVINNELIILQVYLDYKSEEKHLDRGKEFLRFDTKTEDPLRKNTKKEA